MKLGSTIFIKKGMKTNSISLNFYQHKSKIFFTFT